MTINDLISRVSGWFQHGHGHGHGRPNPGHGHGQGGGPGSGGSRPDPSEPPVGSTVGIGDQVWHRRSTTYWRNCELGVPQNPVDKTWAELQAMGTVEVIHAAK